MTFISMSITAYATHVVGALAVGIAIGAGVVYAIAKTTEKQQLTVSGEPVKEEKQLLILENTN